MIEVLTSSQDPSNPFKAKIQASKSNLYLFKVVKWQNVCVNIPMAVKEMVMARSLGQIDASTFRKMLQTACSKLCALPVCVVTWLLSYRYKR